METYGHREQVRALSSMAIASDYSTQSVEHQGGRTAPDGKTVGVWTMKEG